MSSGVDWSERVGLMRLSVVADGVVPWRVEDGAGDAVGPVQRYLLDLVCRRPRAMPASLGRAEQANSGQADLGISTIRGTR